MEMDAVDVPEGHPWRETPTMDRMVFWCADCAVTIPVTAADPQAGIQLFCPGCDAEMDDRWFYDE